MRGFIVLIEKRKTKPPKLTWEEWFQELMRKIKKLSLIGAGVVGLLIIAYAMVAVPSPHGVGGLLFPTLLSFYCGFKA